ncbi:MAG: hypothetical protein AAFV53_06745, partial [Myxococcota bacterium]
MTASLLVRAPDHLGDGVMALSAIQALRPTIIIGPRWAPDLYANLGARIHPPGGRWPDADLAVLFKPSLRAAIAARHARRRIGVSHDARWPLLSDVVPTGRRHRIETYARLARLAGAPLDDPLPRYAPSAGPAVPEISRDAVLLLPGTASPETVRWSGFRDLADRLAGSAVFTGGPDEDAIVRAIAGPHRVIAPLS